LKTTFDTLLVRSHSCSVWTNDS